MQLAGSGLGLTGEKISDVSEWVPSPSPELLNLFWNDGSLWGATGTSRIERLKSLRCSLFLAFLAGFSVILRATDRLHV
jgi:hypothetical protein